MDNTKLFYLKGAFDGDGHYSKDGNKITINVTDFDFLEEIQRLIKELFNIEVNIKLHTPKTDKLKEQRRINFYCGKDIYNIFKKRVPITLGEKKEYLKGLWDAEGSVGITPKTIKKKNGKIYSGYDKWLTIAQKDTSKLDVWKMYMSKLGIVTNKLYRTDTRSYLSVRKNQSIINFSKYINFKIERKRLKLNEVLNIIKKSHLSKQEMNQIIEIYTQTNFGTEYIGKLFDRTKPAILSTLKRNHIDTNKYRQRKINQKDIQFVEDVLQKPLPFKIYLNKSEKEVMKNVNEGH